MELETILLTRKYKDKLAVNNLNINFPTGIYGLLGPNGAGKTTLMKMLVNILNPSSGEVIFEGKPIKDLGINYRKIVGYLPQKFGFYSNLTIDEYLKYMAAVKGISKNVAGDRINDLLKQVNLLSEKNQKMESLSGGMKQRVGIAQAMLNFPKVLILDEPAEGLDIEERRKFREYISEFSKERIVIISTHIVSDIEFISNNIAIMSKGHLLISGNTKELIKSLDGMIWEVTMNNNEFDYWRNKLQMVNYHNEDSSNIFVRYISDNSTIKNSNKATPELNDYYLYINKQASEVKE